MSDKDIQKTPSSKKDLDVEKVSSEKPLDTGKEPSRSSSSPADPVDAPYPETDRVSDTNTTEKVKISGKETATKNDLPRSIGDEPGSSFPDLSRAEFFNSRVEYLKQASEQLMKAFSSLSPAGQKLLALVLTAGLVIGYGSSAIICNNQKRGYQTQITDLTGNLENVTGQRDQMQGLNDELEEVLLELEDEIDDIETYLEGCQEESQDLQAQVSTLGRQVEEREEEITVLTHGLKESGDMLGLYIMRADLDVERNTMNITLGHTLPVNSIITYIILESPNGRYWDRSEDATGVIMGSMSDVVEKTFIWSPEDAEAPEGFLNTYDSYFIIVATINGYACYHQYVQVKMGIDVIDWGYGDDSIVVAVYNGDQELPFPQTAMIGVRKGGTSVYYNVSTPEMVEEGTLGGGDYAWNATASGAPEGFVKRDTKYFIRVTYMEPEGWYNWDQDYTENIVRSPPRREEGDENGGGEPHEPPEEY